MSDLEVVDFYDGPLAYTAESVDRVIADLRAQLAEQARTLETLQRYATHRHQCTIGRDAPCSCGLVALLATEAVPRTGATRSLDLDRVRPLPKQTKLDPP